MHCAIAKKRLEYLCFIHSITNKILAKPTHRTKKGMHIRLTSGFGSERAIRKTISHTGRVGMWCFTSLCKCLRGSKKVVDYILYAGIHDKNK